MDDKIYEVCIAASIINAKLPNIDIENFCKHLDSLAVFEACATNKITAKDGALILSYIKQGKMSWVEKIYYLIKNYFF